MTRKTIAEKAEDWAIRSFGLSAMERVELSSPMRSLRTACVRNWLRAAYLAGWAAAKRAGKKGRGKK